MKVVHIKIVTVVGLIAILLLQLVWLNNTYSILKKNIVDEGNRLFEEAVYNAASLNFANLPKGTKVYSHADKNHSEVLVKSR